jgi:hypothetical protein
MAVEVAFRVLLTKELTLVSRHTDVSLVLLIRLEEAEVGERGSVEAVRFALMQRKDPLYTSLPLGARLCPSCFSTPWPGGPQGYAAKDLIQHREHVIF